MTDMHTPDTSVKHPRYANGLYIFFAAGLADANRQAKEYFGDRATVEYCDFGNVEDGPSYIVRPTND